MPPDRPTSDNDEADADAGLARIAAGGIPFGATRRLRALAAPGASFTSGLSIGELALLGRMGPRPLAQVMGASVYQVGWQYLPAAAGRTPSQARWSDTGVYELERVSRAWDQARRRALDRLVEEAELVGGDAVIGVRLHRGEHDLAAGAVECVVSGTAIGFPAGARPAHPILTELSMQDYWKLHQAGYAPVGLVATTAVMFVVTAGHDRLERALTAGRNQEYPELSRAVFAARDTARARLLGQARQRDAAGIVGMAFEQQTQPEKFAVRASTTNPGDGERSGLMITFHAGGTAIRRTALVDRYPPETVTGLGGLR